jgi:hypothetical protein
MINLKEVIEGLEKIVCNSENCACCGEQLMEE